MASVSALDRDIPQSREHGHQTGTGTPEPHHPWGSYKATGIWAFLIYLMHCGILRGFLKKPIRILLFLHSPTYDVKIKGLKFRCQIGDNHTDNKVIAGRIDKLTRLITKDLQQGDTFVDIGANCGLFSLIAARKVGLSGNVVTIEPSQVLLPRLHFNVAANSFDQVRILPTAAGDCVGTMPFYVNPKEHGQSSLAPRPGPSSVNVPVNTLFNIVTLAGIRRIDAMKVDVEGYEDRVLVPFLRDAPEALWPRRILIEIANDRLWKTDCVSALLTTGYRKQWASKNDMLLIKPLPD
jgi:FkbM family methyltransferase